MSEVRYTPWKSRLVCQRPYIGSRWFRGNFTLGIAADVHPRFVNVILCLWFIEIGLAFNREYIDP